MNWQKVMVHACTFQVMALIGVTLVIVGQYLVQAFDHELRKKHVLLISLAYVILLLLTLTGVYIGVFFPPYPLWEMRLYGLWIAYICSDFALYYMFHFIHHDHKDEHVKKAG